jgi:filamentous hemagglutinin
VKGSSGPDYLAELVETHPELPADFNASMLKNLEPELRAKLSLEIFFLVLRDAGRNNTVAGNPGFGNYDAGFEAITALFGDQTNAGNISTRSRDIRTKSAGDISLLAPGGTLTLADSIIGTPLAPPGILTEAGGNISIFTDGNVDIGVARIFTLRGGDEIIWSSSGDIAAGSSSKTVQSAPPTRVLIDAQSADLKTDLAGLATGGGIGVLATVAGIPPGSVDLIAPSGVVDAGDAGIRATGDLNIAAVQVLNADNIQVGGTSAGVPSAPTVATPSLAGLSAATNATGAATSAANEVAARQRPPEEAQVLPSIVTVEVVGYGGGDDEDEESQKRKRQQEAAEATE